MVCVEGSSEMIQIAKKNCVQYPHITFIHADLNDLPFENNSFDLIIKRLAPDNIHELSRVLKLGGYFLNLTNGEKDALELKRLFDLPHHESIIEYTKKLKEAHFLFKESKEFVFYETYTSYADLKNMLEIAPIIPDYHKKISIYESVLKKLFKNNGTFMLTRHKYVTETNKTI